jgi:hypothetical protein
VKKRKLHRRYGHARAKAFTVEAGRQILHDGKPFIGIDRTGAEPVVADAVTRVIADCLNTKLGGGGLEEMRRQWMAHGGHSDEFHFARKRKS